MKTDSFGDIIPSSSNQKFYPYDSKFSMRDIDPIKSKSVEEIKEDFDLSKPPINSMSDSNLGFNPTFDKDIKLETDEVLNEDIIDPLQDNRSSKDNLKLFRGDIRNRTRKD
jgi:hypothetical protein